MRKRGASSGECERERAGGAALTSSMLWALDTALPADAVAAASAAGGTTAMLAVSTYQLVGGAPSLPLPATTPPAAVPPAMLVPPSEEGVPAGTKRGCVHVVQWPSDGAGPAAGAAATTIHTSAVGAAVFDIKWDARLGPRLLAAATSAGTVELWRPSVAERVATVRLARAGEALAGAGDAAPSSSAAALLVQWLATGDGDGDGTPPVELAVSMSDGAVAVARLRPDGAFDCVERWHAHTFAGTTAAAEVWAVAQQPLLPATIWSGGDDGSVKAWDRRCGERAAVASRASSPRHVESRRFAGTAASGLPPSTAASTAQE